MGSGGNELESFMTVNFEVGQLIMIYRVNSPCLIDIFLVDLCLICRFFSDCIIGIY